MYCEYQHDLGMVQTQRFDRFWVRSLQNDTDLTKYSPGYDSENRRIPNIPYDELSLIPPTRKHTFAPEVDPADLIDDEAEFEALSGIDWASLTFQDKAADREAEKDNPESSSPPKE